VAILQTETWTTEDLLDLAKRQKQILWMIPLSLLASFNPVAAMAAGFIQLYFVYKLAVAVLDPGQTGYIILYMVLVFIPLAGLVALLFLNNQATKRLRANGISVGLMGARRRIWPR
jgi:hypothetical protein